jgi:hypothetical protein
MRAGSGASEIACTMPRAHLGVGELARACLEPLQVALVVGGVGDRQVALAVQAIGEQVVEHAAVLAAQQAVLRAPAIEVERDLRDVV